MELTDLELCKKIAMIEGKFIQPEIDNERFGYDENKIWSLAKVFNKKQGCFVTEVINYNPVEDWNITGPLMVKHKIELDFSNGIIVACAFTDSELIRMESESAQRAILLAIVAKFEAVK